MEWNEGRGRWFPLGREKFPYSEVWKELSSVTGARRTGAIAAVDAALEAASKCGTANDMIAMQLGAFELTLACDAMLRGIGTFDVQARQRREAVEELGRRAKLARDYYSNATPVLQAILSSPIDIFALKGSGASLQVLVDRVFGNFVAYARANWQYVGKSNWGGPDLLAGTTRAAPCGGIANALRIVLGTVLPEGAPPVRFVTLSGRLVTRKRYHCFDPRVRGNVRLKNDMLDGSCLFNNHYFLGWAGLHFDPCMAATYISENDVVEEVPVALTGVNDLLVVAKENARKTDSLFFYDERTTVPGFSSTWARVPIAEVKDGNSLIEGVPASLRESVRGATASTKTIVDFCARAG